MKPKIIGLVGAVRSGKTTAGNFLCSQYGYTLASNSAILTEILAGMGIEPSRKNLSNLGDSLFKVLGNEIIARYRLASLDGGPIVVDGIRYQDEILAYSSEATFKLIGIAAQDDYRYERARRLDSIKDKFISRQEFEGLSNARSELQVPSLLRGCDVIIHNNGSLDQFEGQLRNLIKMWSEE